MIVSVEQESAYGNFESEKVFFRTLIIFNAAISLKFRANLKVRSEKRNIPLSLGIILERKNSCYVILKIV